MVAYLGITLESIQLDASLLGTVAMAVVAVFVQHRLNVSGEGV
jgi:hypothetical protein